MANPVQNPSFELPGASAGEASDWTEVHPEAPPLPATAAGTACEEVASFTGDDGDVPYEGFLGGWLSNEDAQTGFGLADVVSAFFESKTLQDENFETSWVLPEIAILGDPVWVHQAQMSYWHENFTIAGFDAALDDFEDFEEEWLDVENAVDDLTSGATTEATFDAALDTFEDFEEEWQDVENAVADLAAGAITAAQFDAGANAFENFEGAWPTIVYP